MSNRSNRPGTELTDSEVATIASLDLLGTTPAGQHLAKDALGNIVNTPDSGGGISVDSINTLTNKTLDDYTNFIHADGIHLRVKATENLSYGDVIMFTGFNAGEQAIEVAKRNDDTVPAIGVLHDDLLIGEFGMAVSNGLFKQIDTSAFSEGVVLYPNTTGGFTTTPSISNSNYNQQLAYVVRSHAVNGEIMINVGAGHDLASQVAYDNTTSGLTATNTQDAIDEILTNPSALGLSSDEILSNGPFGNDSVTEDLFTIDERLGNLEIVVSPYPSWWDLIIGSVKGTQTTIAEGTVTPHDYQGTTYYRLSPSPSDPAEDNFYLTFDGTTLSDLVVKRIPD